MFESMTRLTPMDDHIIRTCKGFINEGNTYAIQDYYRELLMSEFDRTPDWPFIFHRVYLHACLRGRSDISLWMTTILYPTMDPIQQIALRQIFPYGRVLLSKAAARGS
jgi:hypothetical protein